MTVEEQIKEYRRRKNNEYHQKYSASHPDFVEWKKLYMREYNKRPEVVERKREYMREYNKRPEVVERRREYQRSHYAAIKEAATE